MTPPETSNSAELVTTTSVYARVPVPILDAVDEWATDRGYTRSMAIRTLVELALGLDEGGPPPPGRNPWIDRAIMVYALQILDIIRPSGYQDLARVINATLVNVGER